MAAFSGSSIILFALLGKPIIQERIPVYDENGQLATAPGSGERVGSSN
jgi:hypothetical protein